MTQPPASGASSIPLFVVKATAIASLGGILFGYDMGVISCALPQITAEFDLTESQQEWVVGILYLGGVLGAALGGILCDAIGRKSGIMVTDCIFILGALILYFAPSVELILTGRVIVGFAISVSGIADVSYLHEMAPLKWRGSIVSVNEACISLGFLLAFAFGMWFQNVKDGWRHLFGISGWLALVQLIGMIAMPESPVWLKQQGRENDRQAALRAIYGDDPAEFPPEERQEVDAKGTRRSSSHPNLPAAVGVYDSLGPGEDGVIPAASTTSSRCGRICHAFRVVTRYRRQAWIALFLAVTQQLSGQASVLNYAPVIFSKLNHSDLFATLWIGVVKFSITVIVILRIEYMGRKFLLLFGMLMIVIGQFVVAFAFSQFQDGSAMYLALPGILLVTLGYSCSFGPLTWLLTSELFPADIRGRALGASTIVTYLFASLVTSTFLSMQSKLGDSTVFFLYGLVTALGMVFVQLAIPDTGNKTADKVDEAVQQMWWWRRDRRELIPSEDSTLGSTQIHMTELT